MDYYIRPVMPATFNFNLKESDYRYYIEAHDKGDPIKLKYSLLFPVEKSGVMNVKIIGIQVKKTERGRYYGQVTIDKYD